MDFDVHLPLALQKRILRKRRLKRLPRLLAGMALVAVGILVDPGLRTVSLTLLGMLALMYVVACFRQSRYIRRWCAIQGDEPIHYHVDEDVIRASSRLGLIELKWSMFREFQDSGDFYTLHYLNAGRLTLPSKDVPEDAVAFIKDRFRSLGLRISGGK